MDPRDLCSEMRVPATPESLWDAITRPTSPARRLFATENGDGVQVGSVVMQHGVDGEESVWGRVVDLERPHRLVMELEPSEHSEHFRVTLNIEREGPGSRLALTWEPIGSLQSGARLGSGKDRPQGSRTSPG